MKKQIFTITMCLTLTSTTALAESTKTVLKTPVKPATTITAPVKTVIKTVTPVVKPETPKAAPAAKTTVTKPETSKTMTKEEAKKYFEEKRAKDRENLYNALGLSKEQKAKAEVLDKKTIEGAEPVFKKAKKEHRKLNELKEKHASFFIIWHQEFVAKSSKNDLRKYFDKSKKEFEAILNPEQKTKFKKLEKERHEQFEAFKKRFKSRKHKHHEGGFGPNKITPPSPAHATPAAKK